MCRMSGACREVVSKVPGVTSVSVSLLTNSMGVEGTALSTDIVAAVEKAGYHASVKEPRKRVVRDRKLWQIQKHQSY